MPKDGRLFMTFPNNFWRHAKIAPLSDNAFRTFVEMNGYSRDEKLDGRIPVAFARSQWKPKSLDELQRNHPTRPTLTIEHDDAEGDVYVIRNYGEHQQTNAEMDATAAKNAVNGAKGGRPRKKPKETQSLSGGLAEGNPTGSEPEAKKTQSQSQESEIDLTDVTYLPESSHVGDRAGERTDLSEEVVVEAKRLGVDDLPAVLDLFEPIVGPLKASHAVELARVILRRSPAPVLRSAAYIARACEKPAEIRRIAVDVLDLPGVVA